MTYVVMVVPLPEWGKAADIDVGDSILHQLLHPSDKLRLSPWLVTGPKGVVVPTCVSGEEPVAGPERDDPLAHAGAD
jgi:hypothetical protein